MEPLEHILFPLSELLLYFTGILLSPKSTLDIPVLFMPDTMKLYEAVVVVHVVKENGENWLCEDLVELNKELKR